MAAKAKNERRVKGKPNLGKIQEVNQRRLKVLKGKKEQVQRRRSAPRLFMKATLANFRRGLNNQRKDTSILRIDDVNTKQDADYYTGKRCCYVYHGYSEKRGVRHAKAPARRGNTRAIWGRVTKPHGGSGAVRAKFKTALPAAALGKRVRVYLFPNKSQ